MAFAVGCHGHVATLLEEDWVTSNWTDKYRRVCKVCNWSRVVECLMTVWWLSDDWLMTVWWHKRDYLGFGGPWVSAVSALVLRQIEAIRFWKPKLKNKKNSKTNLNWSYEYWPRTPVGNTAMNINIPKSFPLGKTCWVMFFKLIIRNGNHFTRRRFGK